MWAGQRHHRAIASPARAHGGHNEPCVRPTDYYYYYYYYHYYYYYYYYYIQFAGPSGARSLARPW
eukprot:14648832-Heterocapsa_arctica.AAC.1